MNLLSRIKSWFTPRDTAQEIIERVKARGALRDTGVVYLPKDPTGKSDAAQGQPEGRG